jgi:hypothetical protein
MRARECVYHTSGTPAILAYEKKDKLIDLLRTLSTSSGCLLAGKCQLFISLLAQTFDTSIVIYTTCLQLKGAFEECAQSVGVGFFRFCSAVCSLSDILNLKIDVHAAC